MRIRTDAEAAHDDVAALLAEGRFADALVPAALQAGRLGVRPRSLTFLAEVVRRGGAAWAAALAEPLPDQDQTRLVRPWLLAATPPAGTLPDNGPLPTGPPSTTTTGPDLPTPTGTGSPSGVGDARLARWLDGVAVLIEARRTHGAAG
ncbi:hypothetical protein [Actinoplanes xinjiangensis]|uniref:hypothetical protein n=1 Tax=Actinoplanes xinjiangensis TaxID=512350 RepID=UPI0034402E09